MIYFYLKSDFVDCWSIESKYYSGRVSRTENLNVWNENAFCKICLKCVFSAEYSAHCTPAQTLSKYNLLTPAQWANIVTN